MRREQDVSSYSLVIKRKEQTNIGCSFACKLAEEPDDSDRSSGFGFGGWHALSARQQYGFGNSQPGVVELEC